MRELPTITLVTPSFNQARFLEKTIRSVLDQGYPKLQYVVMDGGSTDGSVDVIKRYSGSLHYWQAQPDGGQGAAIVAGWGKGNGELVGWINSDDLLLAGSLEAIARSFSPRHQIYYGDDLSIDENDVISRFRVNAKVPSLVFRLGLLATGQPGTFFTRSLAERLGYFDSDLVCTMESDLMLRMFAAGARAKLIPRPLAALRQYPDTKTARLAATIEAEKRILYRKYVPGILGDRDLSNHLRRILRLILLARYFNPLNIERTLRKVNLERSRVSVEEYLAKPHPSDNTACGRKR